MGFFLSQLLTHFPQGPPDLVVRWQSGLPGEVKYHTNDSSVTQTRLADDDYGAVVYRYRHNVVSQVLLYLSLSLFIYVLLCFTPSLFLCSLSLSVTLSLSFCLSVTLYLPLFSLGSPSLPIYFTITRKKLVGANKSRPFWSVISGSDTLHNS